MPPFVISPTHFKNLVNKWACAKFNSKLPFQLIFFRLQHLSEKAGQGASQGHSRTLENTARGRKKDHEVQTHQVKSNSKPPGIAETDLQENFPPGS